MPAPSSLPPPSKRRKIDSTSELEKSLSQDLSLPQLKQLLSLVINQVNIEQKSKAIFALYRVLVISISKGLVSEKNDKKEDLWNILSTYSSCLGDLLALDNLVLRKSCLQILFSLQKQLCLAFTKFKGSPEWHHIHFSMMIVPAVLAHDVSEVLVKEYLAVYTDLRWFFTRDAGTYLKAHPECASNVLAILELLANKTFPTTQKDLQSSSTWFITDFGSRPAKLFIEQDLDEEEEELEDDDWRKFFDEPDPKDAKGKSTGPAARIHTLTLHQSLHSLASHRATFTRIWLTLLPHMQSQDQTIRALNILHRGVLPHLTRPILVMDWVSEQLDRGGIVALLSLNAIYELMKGWNLDYPQFYTRLYALLDRDILHVKYRARFFRLLDTFLSSTLLPSHLLASFIKRLSYLSLSAPPSAIITLVPLIYKLLHKNPALMTMIHQEMLNEDSELYQDPYNATHTNPLLSQALVSSLWEIQAHANHYQPAVASLARVLSEPFTKESLGSGEEWLDHGYLSMISHELGRKPKKERGTAIAFGLEVVMKEKDLNFDWVFGGGETEGMNDSDEEVSGDDDDNGVELPSPRDNVRGKGLVEDLWSFGS